ncbi:MAG: glycosyltransferase family 2 protein [Lachnospiraceae bacterium]|nr:glycosyltransferase family 2 protein [Lachnospiraceae bacterium]
MKTIEIMMATYNGERFLREQIDSILNQDCEEKGLAKVKLTVRDDGSSDRTCDIVEEYVEKYPSRVRLVRGKNVGVIKGFFSMLKNASEADYYGFSDQDDFWKPHKISRAIEKLQEMEVGNKPALYCCKVALADENLNEIDSEIDRSNFRGSFENAMIENIAAGCTEVFNQELRSIIIHQLPAYTEMHDWWLYLTATAFGEFYYDEEPFILYRQHSGNVVGMKHGYLSELKMRVERFNKNRNKISRQLKEFIRVYKSRFPDNPKLVEAEELLETKKSFRKRVKFFKSHKIYRQRKMDNRIFKIILMMGNF